MINELTIIVEDLLSHGKMHDFVNDLEDATGKYFY